MAAETDSEYSGLIMSLVLMIFLAVGLIAWASTGTTNSSTNPQINVPRPRRVPGWQKVASAASAVPTLCPRSQQ